MSSTRRASGGLGYCQWPPLEPDDMSESLSRRWYVQTSGQSELCSLCGCTHLQFFILRDFVQCCASFWRESLACPRLGRGVLHWQLSGEGEAVFLNVAMLSWLVACTQVWRLGQVHESQPRSVPFPAHLLLLQLLGFGLTASVLTNQSPWCPASCFQTPFNCSMVGVVIAEGLTQANWSWLWKCSVSFVRFPHTFSSTTAPGSSHPLSVALFPFEYSLFNGLRSPFLRCWANQIDSNLLFRRGGVLIFNIMPVTFLVCFISFCCDSPLPHIPLIR